MKAIYSVLVSFALECVFYWLYGSDTFEPIPCMTMKLGHQSGGSFFSKLTYEGHLFGSGVFCTGMRILLAVWFGYLRTDTMYDYEAGTSKWGFIFHVL